MAKKTPVKSAPAATKAANRVIPVPRKSVTVEGADIPTYYVNHVNVDLSSWDLRLRLGQIQGLEDGVLQVKEIAHVFLAHGHAKAVMQALKTSLEKISDVHFPAAIDDQTR